MTWYDDNERRAYPLTGDDDGAVPADIVVDILVHAPQGLGAALSVASVVVTSLVVSVVLAIDGAPVAYVTAENTEDLVQNAVPVAPIAAGVSGFVTFGSGIRRQRLNVTGTYGVLDSCLVSFPVSPSVPTLTVQGRSLFGRVVIEAGTDITITAEDVVIDGVGTRRAAVIRLAEAVRGEPVGAGFKSAEAALATSPVRLINGVPPPLQIQTVVIKELPTEAAVDVVPDTVNHAVVFRDHGEPCA
jgi:hypothetical protein